MRPTRGGPPRGADFPDVSGMSAGIVVSQFNSDITGRLCRSGVGELSRHGVRAGVYEVPGAFEIPGVIARLIRQNRHDGYIAFGCVIRGQTDHYDLVAAQAREQIGRLAASGDVPVMFGVLAVRNRAQALARAGGRKGDLGAETAQGLVRMLALYRRLS